MNIMDTPHVDNSSTKLPDHFNPHSRDYFRWWIVLLYRLTVWIHGLFRPLKPKSCPSLCPVYYASSCSMGVLVWIGSNLINMHPRESLWCNDNLFGNISQHTFQNECWSERPYKQILLCMNACHLCTLSRHCMRICNYWNKRPMWGTCYSIKSSSQFHMFHFQIGLWNRIN